MGKINIDRSYSLVGRYMYEWSMVESEVDEILTVALSIKTAESLLVATILTISQKIRILRVLTDFSSLTGDNKTRFQKAINDLDRLSKDRNIVVHNMFTPTKDGTAVKFLVVKTRGRELQVPATEWSEKEFEIRFQELVDLFLELREFTRKLSESKSGLSLADALAMYQDRLKDSLGSLD